jgi:hypothetical protein
VRKCWLLAGLAAGCGVTALLKGPEQELPLRRGTKWAYRGTTATGDVSLTVVVEDTQLVDGELSARLKTTWTGEAPGVKFVRRAGGRYWLGDSAEVGGEPFLMLPMVEGQRFCPEPDACWEVAEIATATVAVKGAPAAERNRYRLVQGSRYVELVTGIGVVAFGAPGVEVSLTEVVIP